jgi:hypothetical protein
VLPPPRGVSLPAHTERRSPFIERIVQTLTANRNRHVIEERWNSYNPKTLRDVGSDSDSDLEFNDSDLTSNDSGSEFNYSDSDEDYYGGK